MKHSGFFRFSAVFLAMGILGLILISTFGSQLVTDYVVNTGGLNLYTEANQLASLAKDGGSSGLESLKDFSQDLGTMSRLRDADYWLLRADGTILFRTGQLQSKLEKLQNFDPLSLGKASYSIGNFFNSYEAKQLTVLVPITRSMHLQGYLAITKSLSFFEEEASHFMVNIYWIYLLQFTMIFFLVSVYTLHYFKPLDQISQGANAYAQGTLDHIIPVTSGDELGKLAATLNYMARELDKSNENQRQFISNVSHDFRSPLTSIRGYLEAILDGTIPQEMEAHYLAIVLDETQRLNKLTESLLTLNTYSGRGYLLDLQPFDMNEVLRKAAASFGGLCMKRKIMINLLLEADLPLVSADPQKITQVLYNLIDNAIKFSPNGSTITLESSVRHGKVFISVKDKGWGIPPENLPKIWDRFYKEDVSRGRDRHGTGLGLSIVKEIIEAHKEHINVISTQGVGSEFLFSLPKA